MNGGVDPTWADKEVPSPKPEEKPLAGKPEPSFSKEKKEELIDPFEEAKEKYRKFTPAPEAPEPPKPAPIEPDITEILPKEPIPAKPTPPSSPVEPIKPPPVPQPVEPPLEEPPPIKPIPPEPEEKAKKEKPPTALWKTIVKILLLVIGVGLFIYLFLNWPAYYAKAKYLIEHWGGKKETSQEILSKPLKTIQQSAGPTTSGDIFLPFVQQAMETPVKNLEEEIEKVSSGTSINLADLKDNTLIIPKIEIKAPIIWNSPPDENTMLEYLQKGIVHYAGTALPGQGKGPIFITGHSSYYWWDKGQYKTVFVNLDKLENGDEIGIGYENKVYVYKVYEKIVVKPEQVEVLNPVDEPILALMTCVPIGTNNKRLIVRAKEIELAQATTVGEEKETEKETTETTEKQPTTQPSTTTDLLDTIYLLPWLW